MSEEVSKSVHHVSVFADNFQFQLQDQVEDCDYPEFWNDALLTQLFVFGQGIIGISTVRDQDVDVTLEIYDKPMDEKDLRTDPDLSEYDHAAQCNLELPSGKLLITGCTSDYEDALKLTLPARNYGVRLFWSNLDAIDELGFEGDDAYLIQLWPDTQFDERILKVWKNLAHQLNPDNN